MIFCYYDAKAYRNWQLSMKNNNTSSSVEINSTSQVEKPQTNRGMKVLKNKAIIFTILLLLVFATATLLVKSSNTTKSQHTSTSRKSHQKVIFTVNGTGYEQDRVEDLLSFLKKNERISTNDATKKLFELLEYKAAAQASNIKFTDGQLSTVRKNSGVKHSPNEKYEQYLNLVAYKNATNDYLETAAANQANGHFAGYSFIFHFDETLTNGDAYRSPNFGNQKLFVRDQKHAMEKAKHYHQLLSSNKISPDNALTEIKKDPLLGYGYATNSNDSSMFDNASSGNWKAEVLYLPIINYISASKTPGLSDIQTGKVKIIPNPATDSDYKDGYYYFVLLNVAQPLPKSVQQTFDENLKTVTQKSKYLRT